MLVCVYRFKVKKEDLKRRVLNLVLFIFKKYCIGIKLNILLGINMDYEFLLYFFYLCINIKEFKFFMYYVRIDIKIFKIL